MRVGGAGGAAGAAMIISNGGQGGSTVLEPDAAASVDAASPDARSDASVSGSHFGPPFVAAGYGTLRAFSADGKSWTRAPDPTSLPAGWSGPPVSGDNEWLLRGACYGDGKFIVVGGTGGDKGLMLSSPNGKDWTLVGGQMANDDCAYGNGVWVTQIRYSSNGLDWTKINGTSCREMVFGAGRFVSAGDHEGGNISYTKDGKAWTDLAITFVGTGTNRKGYNRIAYGNGHFIAVNNFLQTAPIFEWDGSSDTAFKETARADVLGENTAIDEVAYGQGAFYIATPGFLFRRADGATAWQKTAYKGTASLHNLVVTDSLFLTDQAWSADGTAFVKATNPPTAINKIVATVVP